jgi:hypothetical protein
MRKRGFRKGLIRFVTLCRLGVAVVGAFLSVVEHVREKDGPPQIIHEAPIHHHPDGSVQKSKNDASGVGVRVNQKKTKRISLHRPIRRGQKVQRLEGKRSLQTVASIQRITATAPQSKRYSIRATLSKNIPSV